jgi:hypothetical protein
MDGDASGINKLRNIDKDKKAYAAGLNIFLYLEIIKKSINTKIPT